MKNISEFQTTVGGRTLTLRFGKLAPFAASAVLAQYGQTAVLATVAFTSTPREEIDYLPLQVEYVERLYAGGRIKGSRWVKREGRPSDEAILTARLVDRAIRPLFPSSWRHETQVVITVLSVDNENEPNLLALVAASAALCVSPIPWQGPVGAVRVGLQDGTCFVNPRESEKEFSDLDLVVAVSPTGVVMLEGGANQVPEDQFIKAVEFGAHEGEKLIQFLKKIRQQIGKPKMQLNPQVSSQWEKEVSQKFGPEIKKIVVDLFASNNEEEGVSEKLEILSQRIGEVFPEKEGIAAKIVAKNIFKKFFRQEVLAGKRVDGRGSKEIRPIEIEVGVLPRTHGSAIFTRGKTQVLTVTTLGSPALKQMIESPEGEEVKRYIHHYFMPPYATGEVGRFGWPNRREVGHGALAERALLPVLPPEERFPYTIRVVSEVVGSNGSTSMASVCGSTLSLMDAGVPISAPVAGISIGLVKENDRYQLLTDIIGLEDFNGDMDFKVAGTHKGITAIQVDTKLEGLELEIVRQAIQQAKVAREEILSKMEAVLPKPRGTLSRWAPRVEVVKVPLERIGDLIGPGGRVIRKLIEETECTIDIEDDGTVSVTGMSEEAVKAAVAKIKALTAPIQPGRVYEGVVKRLQPFGLFVEFLPGKEGLVHISQFKGLSPQQLARQVRVGQKVKVKVLQVDEFGRANLILVSPRIRRLPPPFASTPRYRPKW